MDKLFKYTIVAHIMGESIKNVSAYKPVVYIVACLLLIHLSHAATIHGTVYNIVLDPESDVRLEINTLPKQFMISKDGNYSFNVPNGNYAIKAYTQDSYAEENITILDDGDYVIDIVLMPLIGESVDNYLPNEYIDSYDVSLQDPDMTAKNNLSLIIGIILVICISIMLLVLFVHKQISKEQQKNVKKDVVDIVVDSPIRDKNKLKALEFIKHNERTTQKDLRKQLPLSEAKISLIVAELEHEGRIKKIRKGRGNILAYVK